MILTTSVCHASHTLRVGVGGEDVVTGGHKELMPLEGREDGLYRR